MNNFTLYNVARVINKGNCIWILINCNSAIFLSLLKESEKFSILIESKFE